MNKIDPENTIPVINAIVPLTLMMRNFHFTASGIFVK